MTDGLQCNQGLYQRQPSEEHDRLDSHKPNHVRLILSAQSGELDTFSINISTDTTRYEHPSMPPKYRYNHYSWRLSYV